MNSTNKSLYSTIGGFAAKTVFAKRRRAYWFDRKTNFGDLLTPALLSHYGYKPIFSRPNRARLAAVGSIIHLLPSGYSGIVLGSGLIRDESKPLHQANFPAVRGPLTRDRVGAPGNIALGDPGLLADRLLDGRADKRYTLGLVPHMYDVDDPRIEHLKSRYSDEVVVVDVRQDPRTVICSIDQCEIILSSSLHGLIVADALGIPAGWLRLSDRVPGGGFKFNDYNNSVGASPAPVSLDKGSALSALIKEVRTPDKDLSEMSGRLEALFRSL